jgi:uncharacterized protein Yka (UPF0111/DUF47 family)
LSELEHIADDIYEQYLTAVFRDEGDVKELIKQRALLNELENTMDITKHAAKAIKTIIIKYV